jgi:hypothetical protein
MPRRVTKRLISYHRGLRPPPSVGTVGDPRVRAETAIPGFNVRHRFAFQSNVSYQLILGAPKLPCRLCEQGTLKGVFYLQYSKNACPPAWLRTIDHRVELRSQALLASFQFSATVEHYQRRLRICFSQRKGSRSSLFIVFMPASYYHCMARFGIACSCSCSWNRHRHLCFTFATTGCADQSLLPSHDLRDHSAFTARRCLLATFILSVTSSSFLL